MHVYIRVQQTFRVRLRSDGDVSAEGAIDLKYFSLLSSGSPQVQVRI